jgi:hypothetical protein
MRLVPFGVATSFRVPDTPEWGGLLALGRGVESLYVSRWAFLVPGFAIALSAIAFAMLGVGIARQYQRRNLPQDLQTRRAFVGTALVLALVVPAFLLPAPHADAIELSAAARSRAVIGSDPAALLAAMNLAVTPIDRATTQLQQVGPAALRLDGPSGPLTFNEGPSGDYVPLLFGASGGGTIDAPLVFAGWGVSPADFPPQHTSIFSAGDFGTLVAGWEDDYAHVDVRGKVALIFRIANIQTGVGRQNAAAPTADVLIQSAIKRGAAAVLWVDASRSQIIARGQPDPYRRLVSDDPLTTATGVPVFLLTPEAADRVLAPVGVSATAILRGQLQGDATATQGRSMARELAERAHVELPIAPVASSSHSVVALTPAPAGAHRLVIWAVAPSLSTGSRSAADALSALVRALTGRALPPLAFVVFDPRGDPVANAKAVRATLGTIAIDDVFAIDSLAGSGLRFATVYGDLVPAIDDYAARAGAAALRTAGVISPGAPETGDLLIATGLSAFVDEHWVLMRGQGPVSEADDLRADAAAMLAYVVARYAAAAPELVR